MVSSIIKAKTINDKAIEPSIVFVGVVEDITNFSNYGKEGFWFPGFDCPSYSFEKHTDYYEMNSLNTWMGPLKHIKRWEIKEYINRSFSMDGPCSTICGDIDFNSFQLPNNKIGISGVIVDPAAAENSNNSVNRIQLNENTPNSFILSIIVDNSAMKYSAIHSIIARGEHQGEAIEPLVVPMLNESKFNGIADIYQYQFLNFNEGDHIKIKFNGKGGSVQDGGGASFGGLLFDL